MVKVVECNQSGKKNREYERSAKISVPFKSDKISARCAKETMRRDT